MAKTVILLNPFGSDVTPFLNPSAQFRLLKGSVRLAGDTLITVPYTNQSGIANDAQGRELLNTAIQQAGDATDKVVLAYSQGAHVAVMWLEKYGVSTPFNPAKLRFIHIGNPERQFGGFVYAHPEFNAVGHTTGYPATLPYSVVDFARQYDGVADFPQSPIVQAALVGVQTIANKSVGALPGAAAPVLYAAAKQIAQAYLEPNARRALLNAIAGMILVHNNYLFVAPSDPQNVSYIDPARTNLKYVWSPTFPAPALGFGGTFMSSDQAERANAEKYTSRPVALPLPLYSLAPWWGMAGFPSAT